MASPPPKRRRVSVGSPPTTRAAAKARLRGQLAAWREQARTEARGRLLQRAAAEAHANPACTDLVGAVRRVAGLPPAPPGPAAAGGWRAAAAGLAAAEWPPGWGAAARAVGTGMLCPCGRFLQLTAQPAAYGGRAVRCDYSGEFVLRGRVWHCPWADEAHPGGFDVGAEHGPAYAGFVGAGLDMRRAEAAGDAEAAAAAREAGQPAAERLLAVLATDLAGADDGATGGLRRREAGLRPFLAAEDWDWRREAAHAGLLTGVADLQHRVRAIEEWSEGFADAGAKRGALAGWRSQIALAQRRCARLAEDSRRVCRVARAMGAPPLPLDLADPEHRRVAARVAAGVAEGLGGSLSGPVDVLECDAASGRVRLAVREAGDGGGRVELSFELDNTDVRWIRQLRRIAAAHAAAAEVLEAREELATAADLARAAAVGPLGPEPLTCAICQCELEPGEEVLRLRGCGHAFHAACGRRWLLGHKSECPLCKAPVVAAPARARVHGLTARPELNGALVELLHPVGETRHRVRTTDGAELVLPRANLAA